MTVSYRVEVRWIVVAIKSRQFVVSFYRELYLLDVGVTSPQIPGTRARSIRGAAMAKCMSARTKRVEVQSLPKTLDKAHRDYSTSRKGRGALLSCYPQCIPSSRLRIPCQQFDRIADCRVRVLVGFLGLEAEGWTVHCTCRASWK